MKVDAIAIAAKPASRRRLILVRLPNATAPITSDHRFGLSREHRRAARAFRPQQRRTGKLIKCFDSDPSYSRLRDAPSLRSDVCDIIALLVALLASMRSIVMLAKRWSFNTLDPLLGLDHAQVAGPPVP